MAARYPGASSEGRTYTSLRDVCGPVGGFPAFSLRVSLCPTWRRKSPMAIYHLSAKPISRATGRSATGAAAYRAGVKITDERTGQVFDYTRKRGIDYAEILAPANATEWAHDRAKLWNAVEATEKRKDAQLCREVEVALPCELTPEQMRDLVRDFARANFVERGMVADVVIHHAKGHNPHAHILLTMRGIGPDGFGQKHRDWNQKELLEGWRKSWERRANLALKKAGHEAHIDHRTLEAQGIERVPQIHIGPHVVEMEAQGIQTKRGARALEIEQTNAQIIDLQHYREAIDRERDYAIEAGAERRAVSRRDRTIGAELGNASGRDAADLSRAAAGQPGAGRNVEPAPAAGRRNLEGSGIEHREVRSAAQEAVRGRDASQPWPDVAALSGGDLKRHAGGGSYERVLALAESARSQEHRDAGRAGRGRGAETSHRGRAEEAAMSQPDRTYLAVHRQLEAMSCDFYEIGIRDRDGRMLTRTWSKAKALKSVPWLKRENAKGADIYVRPAGEENQGLVLVDDLTKGQIDRMKSEGYAPVAVVETSPLNHQAWVRLSDRPLSPEVATIAGKHLAKQYGADLNSADWRHFGRLAGFTNRKPEHTTKHGRSPWVLCHEAPGRVAKNGLELAQKAQKHVFERKAQAECKNRLEAAKKAPQRFRGHDPIREYQNQLTRRLEARYGANMDMSRADFMICKDMAKQGYSSEQLEQALTAASPELPTRKLGHEMDYCQRTVRAVFADKEVQQELQRRHAKSLSRVGPTHSL
ncbi:DNA primase [Gigaspora margarita]|uniref:DNA primase n=1 Tax=Gigaspora margarita TaxID=4874 RepID=A0A8H3WV75_GIGMA|nr:DNA primase [Gigaspora margarita]